MNKQTLHGTTFYHMDFKGFMRRRELKRQAQWGIPQLISFTALIGITTIFALITEVVIVVA